MLKRILPIALLISAALCVATVDSSHPSSSSAAPLPKIQVAPSSRSFTADHQPFVPFGVTYYRPGTGWAPQLWKKFDPAATRQDFIRMHSLGINCVRVFLSYGAFYMEPGVLQADGLQKFDQLLQFAEEAGIYVHPTGPDHWEEVPEWARGDHIADDQVLSALESFWKLFATRYRDRQVIFAYDLRNEPEVSWDSKPLRQKWDLCLTSAKAEAQFREAYLQSFRSEHIQGP